MPVEFYPRSVPLFDVETCRSLDLHNIAKCVHREVSASVSRFFCTSAQTYEVLSVMLDDFLRFYIYL